MSGDSDSSDRSVQPDRSSSRKGLRPSGGYRTLRSFQTATIIYDATVSFCERFVDKRSRTTDQMVQAARSGRQNIAEGSRASAASSQTELRLVSVARASLAPSCFVPFRLRFATPRQVVIFCADKAAVHLGLRFPVVSRALVGAVSRLP